MTKKKKIWIIIIIVLLILVSGSIFLVAKNNKKIEYITQTVERATLKQSVDATGKIESAEKIDLNFKTTGRINNIYVEVGDEIKTGQVLARLEAGALASSVDNARAQVNQAIADYDKLIAGSSPEDIKITEDTAAQKQQALISAENNLTNLKIKARTEIDNLKDTSLTYLNNEIITAQNAMDEIKNTLDDSDAQSTLSILDNNKLSLAEANQKTTQNAVDNSEILITTINSYSSDAEILNALDNLKDTLNLVITALSQTIDVLNATMISSDLSETELDTLKSNIVTEQSGIKTAKTNIQTAKSNWTNKIAYYQDQITIYEDAMVDAQKALDIANSQLALKKSAPRAFEIDAAQAKIDQAQASLKLAQANLNQTIITAPINGTLIKKNYNVGEQTSLASPVLEMIGESNLQIEVDISESDVAKLKAGQDADVSLDAFGDDEIFAGKVTFIDPAETIIQDVVYYKVKIQLNNVLNDASYDIKPGMTANVIICTNKKENVLIVPPRGVKSNNGDKYVEILINGTLEEKIVTTGLRGDERIEIISGLSGGEEVITFVR
ncbi:efflux RND transporter periplasmic adaptor subunit [Patescibacteria group bacterium]|nr:efflux RND transporter periplasmic adaptor subunit [Patescibacteria group bacterium]